MKIFLAVALIIGVVQCNPSAEWLKDSLKNGRDKQNPVTNMGNLNGLVAIAYENAARAELIFEHNFANTKIQVNNYGDFAVALEGLRFFGHLIKELSIDYQHLSVAQSAQLNIAFSRFALNGLNELDLISATKDKLKYMDAAFARAVTVEDEKTATGKNIHFQFQ